MHTVDVFYCGLPIGTQLEVNHVGPTSVFLELPEPMPVGTVVNICVDGRTELPVRVMRIHEQPNGNAKPGMHVRLDSQPEWWETLVNCDDPSFLKTVPANPVEDDTTVPQAMDIPRQPGSEAIHTESKADGETGGVPEEFDDEPDTAITRKPEPKNKPDKNGAGGKRRKKRKRR